jgi:GT2 family glycosyltransferase
MLMRREVFQKIGLFSEEYFMYAEDIDLNYKAKQAGFTNYYIAEAAIVHHGGKSSVQQSVNYWSTIMKSRAMRRLFGKMGGRMYGFLYRMAICVVAMARLTLLTLVYPVSNLLWRTDAHRIAIRKWTIILKWAFGRQESALGGR